MKTVNILCYKRSYNYNDSWPLVMLIQFIHAIPGAESISMIDPVIDEHFRRSLGADYMHLFDKRPSSVDEEIVVTLSPKPSPSPVSPKNGACKSPKSPTIVIIEEDGPPSPIAPIPVSDNVREQPDEIELSVDDHFAKALGDTWKKLQEADKSLPIGKNQSDNNSS